MARISFHSEVDKNLIICEASGEKALCRVFDYSGVPLYDISRTPTGFPVHRDGTPLDKKLPEVRRFEVNDFDLRASGGAYRYRERIIYFPGSRV